MMYLIFVMVVMMAKEMLVSVMVILVRIVIMLVAVILAALIVMVISNNDGDTGGDGDNNCGYSDDNGDYTDILHQVGVNVNLMVAMTVMLVIMLVMIAINCGYCGGNNVIMVSMIGIMMVIEIKFLICVSLFPKHR